MPRLPYQSSRSFRRGSRRCHRLATSKGRASPRPAPLVPGRRGVVRRLGGWVGLRQAAGERRRDGDRQHHGDGTGLARFPAALGGSPVARARGLRLRPPGPTLSSANSMDVARHFAGSVGAACAGIGPTSGNWRLPSSVNLSWAKGSPRAQGSAVADASLPRASGRSAAGPGRDDHGAPPSSAPRSRRRTSPAQVAVSAGSEQGAASPRSRANPPPIAPPGRRGPTTGRRGTRPSRPRSRRPDAAGPGRSPTRRRPSWSASPPSDSTSPRPPPA